MPFNANTMDTATEKTFTYPQVYLYRRIVQAKLYIDGHFAEPIDLHNIADQAVFSRFHFLRLFRRIYGKTPHQYLVSVRIDKVCQLLAESDLPVSTICGDVGFESVSSFTGLFKKTIGKTPSEYRASQQALQRQTRTTPLKFVPNCFAKAKGWSTKSNCEEVTH